MKTIEQALAYLSSEIANKKYEVELLEQAVKITRQEIKDGETNEDELEHYQMSLDSYRNTLRALLKVWDFINETPQEVLYKQMVDNGELPF